MSETTQTTTGAVASTAPQSTSVPQSTAPRTGGFTGSRPPFRGGPGGAPRTGGFQGRSSTGGYRGRNPRGPQGTTPAGAPGAVGTQAPGGFQGRGGYRGGGNRGPQTGGPGRPGGFQGRGGQAGGRRPFNDRKPEFEQKMIDIRRVTRVVAGGRRFSFSVALVAGDRNGRVGFGMGKATDTSLAIEKAFKQARKNMLTLRLTKTKSIRHDVNAKFGSAVLTIMPNKGRGLIAGSAARVVLSFAGVKDVTAKYHSGTKNKINNAKAAIEALRIIAYKYGEAPVKKVEMQAEVDAEVVN